MNSKGAGHTQKDSTITGMANGRKKGRGRGRESGVKKEDGRKGRGSNKKSIKMN